MSSWVDLVVEWMTFKYVMFKCFCKKGIEL